MTSRHPLRTKLDATVTASHKRKRPSHREPSLSETTKRRRQSRIRSSTAMDTSTRCQYQSSTCMNERAVKDNGERHRLCAFHRDKANETQRLWQLRHKGHSKTTLTVEAAASTEAPYKRRSCAHLVAAAAAKSHGRVRTDRTSTHENDLDLKDEEIELLTEAVVDYNVRSSSDQDGS